MKIGFYNVVIEGKTDAYGPVFLDYRVVATSRDEARMRAKLRYKNDPCFVRVSHIDFLQRIIM